MTLRHMNIFCALIDNDCNATKTAALLNMTQPAVSLAIRELEQYYGTLLFDRIGKRLKVTENGLIFYEYASHITAMFRDMELALKNSEKTGTVRIGASISIGSQLLPAYIRAFNESFPRAKVKAVIAPSEQLEARVLNSELDFALIEGLVHHPDIVAENYMDDRLLVICSGDSNFKDGQLLPQDEFRNQSFLLREKKSAARDLFDAVLKKAGIIIDPAWESASTTAIINGVINNIGISVLPEKLVKRYIASGEVKPLRVEGLSFERSFKLIYHKDKLLTSTLREFMKICKSSEANY